MTSFAYENKDFGFEAIGKDAKISNKASFYNTEVIRIGSNVRIDDFCILSGKITIGDNVHISAYTSLFAGDAGIFIGDYCTISSRCAIYAISDDYGGDFATNPCIPIEYRNVIKNPVIIEKYSIIGSGCTVLPGVVIGEGAAIGSMSLVRDSISEWGVYAGIPCKRIKDRKRGLLKMIEKIENGGVRDDRYNASAYLSPLFELCEVAA